VERAIRTFAIASAEARQSLGETHAVDAEPGGEDYVARSERFPLGVVAAISPFNFPLNLVAHKVAPALAVGDPVVIAGTRASVKITASGVTAWQPGRLEALVRAFRGLPGA
jgi:acyl-CoA reductase-like NAD-dependent aldehyde dehydrogenase